MRAESNGQDPSDKEKKIPMAATLQEIKAYRTVRGSAVKNVEAPLPHVGDLVLKYAP